MDSYGVGMNILLSEHEEKSIYGVCAGLKYFARKLEREYESHIETSIALVVALLNNFYVLAEPRWVPKQSGENSDRDDLRISKFISHSNDENQLVLFSLIFSAHPLYKNHKVPYSHRCLPHSLRIPNIDSFQLN